MTPSKSLLSSKDSLIVCEELVITRFFSNRVSLKLFNTHFSFLSIPEFSATAIDFRADNDLNLESLEKNSIDLYSSLKSVYLQDRDNKIKNSTEPSDEWGSLDN